MQAVPAGTQIVGFSPEVNMTDKKSAVVNRYQQAYTIQDIANAICNPFVISTDGVLLGNIFDCKAKGNVIDASTGDVTVPFYFATELSLAGQFYPNGDPSFIHITSALYLSSFSYENNNTVESITLDDTLICFGVCSIATLPALTNLSFAALQQVYLFNLSSCDSIQSISLPSFTHNLGSDGGGIQINGNTNLQSVSIPNSIYVYLLSIADNPALSDVVVGTIGILKRSEVYGNDGTLNWSFVNNALSEESVDGILALAASLDGTNGTTLLQTGALDLSGGTNAPPSVAGLANKAVLEGRGVTVTVNVAP